MASSQTGTPLIEGSFVALITPMNADGTIDFEGYRTLIQFHEENGTSAILFMGSTGEVSMLSQEERHAIVRETMKFRTGRMNFYYGCTGTTTAGTIDYVRQAGAEGADGGTSLGWLYVIIVFAIVIILVIAVGWCFAKGKTDGFGYSQVPTKGA